MGNAGARLGVQIGFAVVGAVIGGGMDMGMTGFMLGSIVGGIVGSLLFPIESPDQASQGPKLGDLSVQTSTYGNAIPVVYGTVRIAGNVIWSTGLIEHVNTITRDVESGKGGSQPQSTVTTYSYTISCAIALCANEIVGIKRIWADDKLWYDFSDPPVGVSFNYELYTGTETQLPCSAIEADKGAGNVPAFRGIAYIVFKDLDLTGFGNRVPNFHFEVVAEGTQTINAQFYTDIPAGTIGFWRNLAIDEETGYVWYTCTQQNKITVVTPDLELVQEYEDQVGAPYMISYQPPYMYIKMPPFGPAGIGQEPELKEMPPHMWISGDVWGLINIGGASAAAIETRTGKVQLNNKIRGPLDTVFQPWLGIVGVDRRTIHEEDIHQEAGQYVHFMGRNVNPNVYSWTIADEGMFGNTRTPQNPLGSTSSLAFSALANFFISDFDASDRDMTYVYTISSHGYVDAVDEYFTPVFRRRAAADFANYFCRVKWDKFERCVYALAFGYSSDGLVHLVKMDEFLQTTIWDVAVGPAGAVPVWVGMDVHPNTGALYAFKQIGNGGNLKVCEIDKATGASIVEYEVTNWTHSLGNSRIWCNFKIYPNSMFVMVTFNAGGGGQAGSGIARIPLTPAPTGSPPTLQTVVEDISTRTGLTLSDVSASSLASDLVSGYAIAQRMSARAAIEPLMRGYFFDAVESDHVAKFIKRGGSSIKTIASRDLAAHEQGSEVGAQLERSRIEENELPWQVDVNYLDPVSFYKINVQYARRLIGQTKQTMQINIPVVFTSTQARRIADVLLYNSWVERQQSLAKTTRKYLDLDPADIITVVTEPNLPLLDDFDRPDTTPPTKWKTIEGGGVKIVGGTLQSNNLAVLSGALHEDTFFPDIDIEVTIGKPSLDSTAGCAIAFRFQDKNITSWEDPFTADHYEVEFGNFSGVGIQAYADLYRRHSTGYVHVGGSSLTGPFNPGDRVRVSARGSQFAVYVNDVRMFVLTDTVLTGGNYIGIGFWEDNTELSAIRVGSRAVTTTQDYRITRAEFTAPNGVDLTLVEEDTSAYLQYSTGIDNEVPSQTIPEIVPTMLFLMDTSILGREQDNNSGFYVVVAPSFGASWPGAGVYRSTDSGISYAAVTEHTVGGTAGSANSSLGYEGSIP